MEIVKLFNIKKFGLGLAIIIVFSLFINYGISTFYKAPEYDNFCKPEEVRKTINEKDQCEAVGGLWSDNPYFKEAPAKPISPNERYEPIGWCDAYFKCGQEFKTINDIYKRNVFVVWVIAGVMAIVVSFFIMTISTLSTSFMFAGLLSLLIGTIQYWSAMQDYLRFIVLGIALMFLIYIAYKKLKND